MTEAGGGTRPGLLRLDGLAVFRPVRHAWRVAVAPVVTALAVLLQIALLPDPGIAPFPLLSFGVVLSSWLGGRASGLLSVALSAAAANYFFLPGRGWPTSTPELTATAFFVAASTVVALLSSSFREALAAQRDASERLKLALIAGHSGTFEWETDRIRCSEELLELYGICREDFGERLEDWLDCVVPEDRESCAAAVERAMQTGHFAVAFRIRRRDTGELRWMHGSGRVLFDAAHRPLRITGLHVDVTAREKAEEARRQVERRYRALFDAIDEGFCIIEMLFDESMKPVDYRFLEVNPAFERQTGLVGAKGRTVSELSPGQEEHWFETYGRIARTGEPERFQDRAEKLNRWYDVYAFRFGNPEHHHVAVLFNDITDRKISEEALRAANAQLAEADRRKNEFLAVLSHELRNPLAPIRNSSFILERAAPGGEQARRALGVIERQVHHLTRLIDDLLDVTRISNGKIRLQREPVLLNDLVRGTAEDLRSLFMRNRIRFEIDVTDEPLRVWADRTRLTQIVGNLLQNAAKFTPDHGRVRLSLSGQDGNAVIEVRDDGAGIEPGLLSQLFEPFVQAEHTLNRARGGLGLGLALVKGLSELHGGTASVDSRGTGKGAVFTVRIPLDRQAATRVMPASPAPSPASAHRVLLIEDNPDAAMSLKEALELKGHRVDLALSGNEGLRKARRMSPDVVLCDIGLPGLDGYGVARALRSDPRLRSVFLVALSGYALQKDLERSRSAGFDHHVAKPPDLDALDQLLAQVPGARAASG